MTLDELARHRVPEVPIRGLRQQEILRTRNRVLEESVRQDDVGARYLWRAGDRIEDGATAVDDHLQLQVLDVLADCTFARGRFDRRDRPGIEHLEEAKKFGADLGQ